MLPDVMGQEARCCDLEFDVPDATDWAGASLVIVSNNPYQLRRFRGRGHELPTSTPGSSGIFTTSLSGAAAVAKLVTLGTIPLSSGASAAYGNGLRSSSRCARASLWPSAWTGRRSCSRHLCASVHCRVRSAFAFRATRRGSRRRGERVPLNRRNLWALVQMAAGKPASAASGE